MNWNWNKDKSNQSQGNVATEDAITESTTYDSGNTSDFQKSESYSDLVVRNTFAPPNPDQDSNTNSKR